MVTVLVLVAATILPPVAVSVRWAPSIPRALLTQTLDEASAIWSTAGVTLAWEFAAEEGSITRAAAHLDSQYALRVTIDQETGPRRDGSIAIGWILFDDAGVPGRDIHLSYANAMALVREAEGVGTVSRMTVMELRTLVSRTLGRALAHELGHYLLASKLHTTSGLMKASRPASEFLGPQRHAFIIDPELRRLVSAQLKSTGSLARR